jgi:hypothetical protein
VQAVDADDVVATVRATPGQRQKVSIKSGGHSWAANHLRRRGAARREPPRQTAVDAGGRSRWSGPARRQRPGGRARRARAVLPAGHCKGVRIGGYLLQGGYGWNSRVYDRHVRASSVGGGDRRRRALYIDADTTPTCIGRQGVRAGLLRRGDRLPSQALSEVADPGQQLLRLPDGVRRRDLQLGPRDHRRRRPAGRVQIVASKDRAQRRDRPAGVVLASPVFADTEEAEARRSPSWTAARSSPGAGRRRSRRWDCRTGTPR